MKQNIVLTGITTVLFSLFSLSVLAQQMIYLRPNPDAMKPFPINYSEADIPAYTLPDPLVTDAGQPVTDAKMWWERRRPELLSLFENEMYGRTPGFSFARDGFLRHPRIEVRAEKKNALNGKAIRREVRLHFTEKTDGPYIDVLLYMPVVAKKPVPAFAVLNFWGNQSITDEPDVLICESWMIAQSDGSVVNSRSTEKSRGVGKSRWELEMIIDRGYAIATACYHDIDPDFDEGFQNGFHPYFYKDGQKRPAANEWGNIGAWAWGLSRILDYLETEPAVDATRVAVAGHSRLGKTALWAGAQDQRFAVVIANNSGFGGGSLSKRVFGETIEICNHLRPHWYCGNFTYYNDNSQALPFDQHELLALIAPRPVYLAVAENDRAADPKGEFLTALNADAVYRFLGTPGIGDIPEKTNAVRKGNMIYDAPLPPLNKSTGATIGYHIRTGGHDVTTFDWEQFLNFTDKFLTAAAPLAADLKDVNPNVFPKDDPRGKEMPVMMQADADKRMQAANLRESSDFAAITTKAQWEAYRDTRILKLKESLGAWPEAPKDMRVKVTRELDGDGFVIHNVVYESRPGLWVSANLYLPKTLPSKMPGIIISHSHHTPKTHGELQDMGMTWARSGVAVLVPDHLGHGERRQHDFITEKDYAKSFQPSRQDYFFRYNSNLQLSAVGESLMGWMVWDLMRGIDVLLKQQHIDPARILLLGSVAGGGDPAGVTAALDKRVACVVPFNFGGWQPESSVLDNPDRDEPWFGEGYWESTRGLKNGARDGFAHFVIVGAVAPRPVVYAHEFVWDGEKDPVWPRLQKIFGFYDAKDKIVPVYGQGAVTGQAGPDNTHCTHIGAVHRAGIYPALKTWFGMPVPEEYSQRRPADELMCWTEEAKKELKPQKLHDIIATMAEEHIKQLQKRLDMMKADEQVQAVRAEWTKYLGHIAPVANPKLFTGASEEVPDGMLSRFALTVEPGIIVPLLLIIPKDMKGKAPVVVMVAQGGKAAFLKERDDVITAFLKEGVAVCLPDVRGTGETSAGSSAGRSSTRTVVSQTNLLLGQPVIGAQLTDLRTVLCWLRTHDRIDAKRIAIWGDSFARVNAQDATIAVPLDADLPYIAEPGGANIALLAQLFEDGITMVYARGGVGYQAFMKSGPYFYLPHEAIVPAPFTVVEALHTVAASVCPMLYNEAISIQNQPFGETTTTPAKAAPLLIEQLRY